MCAQHGAQEHVHVPCQLGVAPLFCSCEGGLLAASGTSHHGHPPHPTPGGGGSPW